MRRQRVIRTGLSSTPELTLPGYYAETDFHLVPGGIHSRCYDGVVYEWAAGSTTMMSNENADVHDSLAARIARTAPGADVLDVGCGFGRTIVALGRELPQARLTGADLSAPVLRLAHLRAVEQGVTARFVQTDANVTDTVRRRVLRRGDGHDAAARAAATAGTGVPASSPAGAAARWTAGRP